ncbi:hypothetical protein N44_02861 [Microcystis aeruginosa NIES-44]|uniref:Uncharacterized protein n=1 Tax=Microcystis aeruginosa NIES-44 TaxID=449439 RepID=A0A0A1VYC8_MICAE|nr:hypothetical protein N44_02861 [Microcystis aeruginosa NIES-44]
MNIEIIVIFAHFLGGRVGNSPDFGGLGTFQGKGTNCSPEGVDRT